MSALLRSCIVVAGQPPALALDSIEPLLNAASAWLKSLGMKLPPAWNEGWPSDILEPLKRSENHEITALFDPSGEVPAQFAVRLISQRKLSGGKRLLADCVVGPAEGEAGGGERAYWVTHEVSITGGTRMTRAPAALLRVPGTVVELLSSYRCSAGLPLVAQAEDLEDGDGIERAAEQIESSERMLPTVLLPPIDQASTLPSHLAGIAHFWRFADADAVGRLCDKLGLHNPKRLLEDGALLFWPGQGEVSYSLPRVASLRRTLAAASLVRKPPGSLSYEELALLKAGKRMRKLEKKTVADGSEASQEEVDRIGRDLRVEKKRTDGLQAELEQARFEIADFVRADSPLEALKSKQSAQRLAITSSTEAINAAKVDFPDEFDFEFLKIMSEADEFARPLNLYLALKWLAREYIPSRRGDQGKADLNSSCQHASGFGYEPNMEPSTMGMFAEDYYFKYRGAKVPAKEHLRTGVSRDPKHILRVAFHYDAELGKVVLRFVGRHQRNRKS